jgi:hypothetical protein
MAETKTPRKPVIRGRKLTDYELAYTIEAVNYYLEDKGDRLGIGAVAILTSASRHLRTEYACRMKANEEKVG